MAAIVRNEISSSGRPTSIVFLASFIGTCIEQYDFQLYGLAAALVFGKLFFPTFDPLVGSIAAFGTLAVGYIARPLGGVVCGHFGDRVGRRSTLLATLLTMGLATFLIGSMPTYAAIGVWAAVGLVLLRFVQGLALGGEQSGAILIAVENAPARKRGLYGSWPQAGIAGGVLLATAAMSLTTAWLSDAELLGWGWRIPFLASIALVVLGVVVRVKLDETPVFEGLQHAGIRASIPLAVLLRQYRKELLVAFCARLAETTWIVLALVFTASYISGPLGLPTTVALHPITAGAALSLVMTPVFGALSDRVGRKPVYLAGAVLAVLSAWPYFHVLDTKDPLLIGAAIVVAEGLLWPMMLGPQGGLFAELFGTRVRYSGVALSQQVAAVIGGGFTPLIASVLLSWSDGRPSYVACYMIVLGLIAIRAIWSTRETRKVDLAEADVADGHLGDGRFAGLPVTDGGSAAVRR